MGAVCVLVGAGIVTIHKTGIVACFVRRCTVVVGFGFIVSSVAFFFLASGCLCLHGYIYLFLMFSLSCDA